jgi:protein-disulfide isomerase
MKLRHQAIVIAILTLLIGLTAATGANAQADEQNVLTRERVLRDPDVPVLGNQKGDITIVEYFDYQCPYCKKLHPVILGVAKEDGNLRLVFKDWPIFGEVSKHAAQLALAAKYQGKYEQAHASLLSAKARLTEGSVQQLLTEAGVDVAKAKADLETNRKSIDDLLARNNAQAEAFGFRGTPAFIIGTFRVPGVLDAASFKAAIKDARAAQKK